MTRYTRAQLTSLLQAAEARYELADWIEGAVWLSAIRSLRDMAGMVR